MSRASFCSPDTGKLKEIRLWETSFLYSDKLGVLRGAFSSVKPSDVSTQIFYF